MPNQGRLPADLSINAKPITLAAVYAGQDAYYTRVKELLSIKNT